MRFTRRRSDRPDSARSRLGSSLEALESRQLLSRDVYGIFSQYAPSDLPVYNPITGQPSKYSVVHQLTPNSGAQDQLFGNEGKIVSGKDRSGQEWAITVHGPGYVIVTDITPNDGVLSDDIDTIQIVGSNINKTYVTGNVMSSFRVPSSGTLNFNRLIAQAGVNTVNLNGFTLAQTVTPEDGTPSNVNTGVYLLGGVRHLSFHDIQAPIDTSTDDAPINVVIGDPSTPLAVEPSIKLDHIFNTVFDSTNTDEPANVPVTTPTVNIIVNGQIRSLDFISTTQDVIVAPSQFLFPVVGTTGRTSIQAQGIRKLNVRAAAKNLTASRTAVPFQNGFSGMQSLGHARFQGTTDAVGLDVNGPIDGIQYDKGMGDPTGVYVGTNSEGQQVPATNWGIPEDQRTYASLGYVAGQVTARRIGKVKINQGNVRLQTPANPDYGMVYRQGTTAYFARPGVAMVNSVITTTGDINSVDIQGDQQNSEIKTGFDYNSYAAGLEGTRSPSRIRRLHMAGDQINSAVSASYRPNNHYYGSAGSSEGPGLIRGQFKGALYATGGITPLNNIGAGFYARQKAGYLPPPQTPTRVNNQRIR